MRRFGHDLRIASRRLSRTPGFAIAAILTLALGIGATTTVFGIVYGVLIRPLPFPNGDRLVRIVQTIDINGAPGRAGLSPDQFANLQERSTTLEAIGTWARADRTLTGVGTPVRMNGAAVAVPLLNGIGIAPALGRVFEDGDSRPGADPVVLLSERTWRRYFGADLAILDRRIMLGGVATRVVGVLPADFAFPSLASASHSRDSVGQLTERPEFWIPAHPFSRTGPSAGFSLLQAYGVLHRGVPRARAESEIRAVAGRLPDGREVPISLAGAREEIGLPARQVLLTFQVGVTLILLIAAVNVANLLLTRAAGRRQEIAVRLALGAGRSGVVRDGLAESLILSVVGGLLGCALAYGLTASLQMVPSHVLPRLRDIRVDGTVVLFACGLSLVTGLAVGLLATLRAGRGDPSPWLRTRGQAIIASHRHLRPSSVLVTVQIATALLLLTASGLLVNSFVRLTGVELGYQPDNVLTFQVELPRRGYDTTEARARVFDGLERSLLSVTGVESVAAEGPDGVGFDALVIDGEPMGRVVARFRAVTPRYFQTLRLPVRQGRAFLRSEAAGVIVNEAFVRRVFGDGTALGRRVEWGKRFVPSEIVGVVANSRQTFDGAEEPLIYIPSAAADGIAALTMFVRAASGSDAIMRAARGTIARLDPELAAYNTAWLDDTLALETAAAKFRSLLAVACAMVALSLAAVGLFGVLSYSVTARKHEIGLRVALGATGRRVLLGVLGHGLLLTAIGIMLGLVASYSATKALSGMLFAVDPRDAATFGTTAIVLLGVATAACYLPARRATRIDPAVALRAE